MSVSKCVCSIVGWKYLLTGELGNLQIAIQLYSQPWVLKLAASLRQSRKDDSLCEIDKKTLEAGQFHEPNSQDSYLFLKKNGGGGAATVHSRNMNTHRGTTVVSPERLSGSGLLSKVPRGRKWNILQPILSQLSSEDKIPSNLCCWLHHPELLSRVIKHCWGPQGMSSRVKEHRRNTKTTLLFGCGLSLLFQGVWCMDMKQLKPAGFASDGCPLLP